MPIRRKHESFIEREVGEGGKSCYEYEVIERFEGMTLLKLNL